MPHKDPETRKAYAAKYRAANKPKTSEYNQAYWSKNKDRLTEERKDYQAKWYQDNRERVLDQSKQYHLEHPDVSKKASKKHYETNKDEILRNQAERWEQDYEFRQYHQEYVKARRSELTHIVNEMKSELGCTYCGEKDHSCLDFHHVNPEDKEAGVSRLVGSCCSLERIFEEITKCTVLCANCHRKLHRGTLKST